MSGRIVGIIPAAGRGERLGAGPWKALVPLCGSPLVSWTADALSRSKKIEDIIVVGGAGALDEFREALEGVPKISMVIEGGETRYDSVRKGFEVIGCDCDVVVIHDCARPFIDGDLTESVIRTAMEWGGAIAAVPVIPTLKKVARDRFIEGTIDRRTVWEAQTPQAFKYDLLKEAYWSRPGARGITDEGLLMEMAGKRVKVVEGSYDNIKITTPVDLKLAELILKSRLGLTNH